MTKVGTFTRNRAFMPVTMQQFEDLTNELLTEVNKVLAPNALDADYMAQILMSALHAYDNKHEKGIVFKDYLFQSCINRISCHVTFHAVEEIKKKLQTKAGSTETPSLDDDEDTVIVPATPTAETTQEVSAS